MTEYEKESLELARKRERRAKSYDQAVSIVGLIPLAVIIFFIWLVFKILS